MREVEEIERRIQKWEAAFETGEMPKEAGADRLLALKDRRRELSETVAKVIPLRPPPHLYSAENIERFRESIRGLFLSGNNAMTRNYLRFLVDRIVLNGTHVELYARTEAAVRVMVSGAKKMTEVITGLPVLTSVIEWLPDVLGLIRFGGHFLKQVRVSNGARKEAAASAAKFHGRIQSWCGSARS